MVVLAPVLEEEGIEFNEENLHLVDGEDISSDTNVRGGQKVEWSRCGAEIAENVDWSSISNVYTKCPGCNGTIIIGGPA